MDINVNNLDLGYDQCKGIYDLILNDGKKVLGDLEENIKNLKIHWIGNDAMVHINNLIKIDRALGALLTDGKSVIAAAAERIVAIQGVRRANSGGEGRVGDELEKREVEIAGIGEVQPTDQYFVDPAAAGDYSDLQKVSSEFVNFSKEFTSHKDELLNNWTAGADRETAVRLFNEFSSNSDEYYRYLRNAETELGKATANIRGLQ